MYKKTLYYSKVLSNYGTGVKFNINKESGTVLTDSSTFFCLYGVRNGEVREVRVFKKANILYVRQNILNLLNPYTALVLSFKIATILSLAHPIRSFMIGIRDSAREVSEYSTLGGTSA